MSERMKNKTKKGVIIGHVHRYSKGLICIVVVSFLSCIIHLPLLENGRNNLIYQKEGCDVEMPPSNLNHQHADKNG